jgi:hypothetical protein
MNVIKFMCFMGLKDVDLTTINAGVLENGVTGADEYVQPPKKVTKKDKEASALVSSMTSSLTNLLAARDSNKSAKSEALQEAQLKVMQSREQRKCAAQKLRTEAKTVNIELKKKQAAIDAIKGILSLGSLQQASRDKMEARLFKLVNSMTEEEEAAESSDSGL